MIKVVINADYGGFSLSPVAEKMLASLQNKQIFFYHQTKYEYRDSEDEYVRVDNPEGQHFYFTFTKDLGPTAADIPNDDSIWFNSRDIPRNDSNLIKVVEELKELASGSFTKLKIVEIPDDIDWEIEEYDGSEWVSEKHRTWR